MSHHSKRVKSHSESKKGCSASPLPASYVQLELPLGMGDNTEIASLPRAEQGKLSCTVELAAVNTSTHSTNNQTTDNHCDIESGLSNLNSVDSTINEKDYKPFWDKFCLEMSEKLWSAISTSKENFSSGLLTTSAAKTIQNSWFCAALISLVKKSEIALSWQLLMFRQADYTSLGQIGKKTLKIRIFPELTLRQVYRKWLAAGRWCYNQAIAYQRDCFIKNIKQPSKYDLRDIVLKSCPDWVASCPYSPREEAVFDAHAAFKKTATNNKPSPKFRSCREPVQSLRIGAKYWSAFYTGKKKDNQTLGFTHYATNKVEINGKIHVIKDLQLNPVQPLCSEMPSEFTILLDRGRWFIAFSVDFYPSKNDSHSCIGLDPGVRTFMTGFDGQKILEIGNGSIGKISSLCQRLDKLQSEIAKAKGRTNKRTRFKLRKLAQYLRIRIRNLIDEIHNKAATYLTLNYKHIFLPTFETSKMVVKKKRKLNSKTARNMLTWSHYRFKQTIKFHALKRGCVVHDVTEEYTSVTCSRCGHVHENLGGKKYFKCPMCNHSLARDWNGAINIFLGVN